VINFYEILYCSDEDDNSDSSPEPLPVPELTHYTKQRPCPPRESTPKVVKRETIVSESHMETRKRVFTPAKQPEKTFQTQTSSTVKSTKMSEVSSGSSWEWKAVLVVLAIITTILLVYYFMEEPSYKPKITTGKKI
jgi:RsiW-degrading membrane proteinase PrsW (M82 family)